MKYRYDVMCLGLDTCNTMMICHVIFLQIWRNIYVSLFSFIYYIDENKYAWENITYYGRGGKVIWYKNNKNKAVKRLSNYRAIIVNINFSPLTNQGNSYVYILQEM